jgi:hypothetical protein
VDITTPAGIEEADNGSRGEDSRNEDVRDRPVHLPSISDYWPDAPHRSNPHAEPLSWPQAAVISEGPEDPGERRRAAAARRPRPAPVKRPRWRLWVTASAVALLVLGGVGVVARLVGKHTQPAGQAAGAVPPPDEPDRATRAASAHPRASSAPSSASPEGGGPTGAPPRPVPTATFELRSKVTTLRLRVAQLDHGTVKVSAPDGSSVKPRVEQDGSAVRLSLVDNGRAGASAVDVTLDTRARWTLRLPQGIRDGAFDLSRGQVAGVDFGGGAAGIKLVLPPPVGVLAVRVRVGINRLDISTGEQAAVTVRAQRGAGKVSLYGVAHDGVAKNAELSTPGSGSADDRIDVLAADGIGTLSIGR